MALGVVVAQAAPMVAAAADGEAGVAMVPRMGLEAEAACLTVGLDMMAPEAQTMGPEGAVGPHRLALMVIKDWVVVAEHHSAVLEASTAGAPLETFLQPLPVRLARKVSLILQTARYLVVVAAVEQITLQVEVLAEILAVVAAVRMTELQDMVGLAVVAAAPKASVPLEAARLVVGAGQTRITANPAKVVSVVVALAVVAVVVQMAARVQFSFSGPRATDHESMD